MLPEEEVLSGVVVSRGVDEEVEVGEAGAEDTALKVLELEHKNI